MTKSQKDRFHHDSSGYQMNVQVGKRILNLTVQKVHMAGGKGYIEKEVLIIQGTDGAPLTVFPRAANTVWVQ